MSTINYNADRQLLVCARGHPYEKDAFSQMFEVMEDFRWSLVEAPANQLLMRPSLKDSYDAVVCYDMPGINFAVEDPPALVEPDQSYKDGLLGLLEAGMGFVFMHHSIASWPAWDEYAEIVGGRFHYRPGRLRGRDWPDSGYRHQVEQTLSVLAEHPVTQGVPATFKHTDELYLCPQFSESFIPLLASDFTFDESEFYSAQEALRGAMFSREGWSHPPGSNIVGWVKHYRNSPIVYLQGGDDSIAYENEHFQRLLHNAIRWVASEDAHAWARSKNTAQRTL
jgi:hypothetical protein